MTDRLTEEIALQDQLSAAGTPAPKAAPYDDQYSYAGTPPVAAAPSEVTIRARNPP